MDKNSDHLPITYYEIKLKYRSRLLMISSQGKQSHYKTELQCVKQYTIYEKHY